MRISKIRITIQKLYVFSFLFFLGAALCSPLSAQAQDQIDHKNTNEFDEIDFDEFDDESTNGDDFSEDFGETAPITNDLEIGNDAMNGSNGGNKNNGEILLNGEMTEEGLTQEAANQTNSNAERLNKEAEENLKKYKAHLSNRFWGRGEAAFKVKKSEALVYIGPGSTFEIIDSLKKDTPVYVIRIYNHWAKIGKNQYVHLNDLKNKGILTKGLSIPPNFD